MYGLDVYLITLFLFKATILTVKLVELQEMLFTKFIQWLVSKFLIFDNVIDKCSSKLLQLKQPQQPKQQLLPDIYLVLLLLAG